MNSYIAPQIPPIPNATGIDAALESMRAKLGAISWLEAIYGRALAQHREGEKGIDVIFPEIWLNLEPENVMPNDNLTAYSFFVARDPQGLLDYDPSDLQVLAQQPVSLIIWANLVRIDSSKPYRYSEQLKTEVITVLKKQRNFQLQTTYEGYGKVFEGYTITEVYRTFLKPPYWACRFDGLLTYPLFAENCPPHGDFNNDFNHDFSIQ